MINNFKIITFNTIYDDSATCKYVQKSKYKYTRKVQLIKIPLSTGYIIGETYKCDCELTLFSTHITKTTIIKRIPFYKVLSNNNTVYLVPKNEVDNSRYSNNLLNNKLCSNKLYYDKGGDSHK